MVHLLSSLRDSAFTVAVERGRPLADSPPGPESEPRIARCHPQPVRLPSELQLPPLEQDISSPCQAGDDVPVTQASVFPNESN